MDNFGYEAVVAVKYKNEPVSGRANFRVCGVPNGALINSGDLVLIKEQDVEGHFKGVCVSDALFLDHKTIDMICRIVPNQPLPLPVVEGKINIDWLVAKEV